MNRFAITAAAVCTLATAAVAQPTPIRTMDDATEILKELGKDPLKSIPPALLADAEGVAIIPNVVKVGFVFAGRGGHGLAMARGKDGKWGEPVFIDLGGASVGFQAGVESTDVVLVFRKRKSLDRLLENKGKVTLGADVSIAAGPLGRKASAATDGKLEAEILSYSRSRGLFAGVALDGAVINPSERTNANFAKNATERDRKFLDALKLQLDELANTKRDTDAPPRVDKP